MQTEIRPLYPSDTEAFRVLRLESLKNDPLSWLATYDEEKDLSNFGFQQKIQYATQQPIFGFYGYFEDGKLLAYAQLSPSYWRKKKHIANLYDVNVSKVERRKGIGAKLIKFIIEKAKAVGYIENIYLFVNSENPGALSFYEKLGFEKIAVHPKAVKELNGTYQDEILYSLRIS